MSALVDALWSVLWLFCKGESSPVKRTRSATKSKGPDAVMMAEGVAAVNLFPRYILITDVCLLFYAEAGSNNSDINSIFFCSLSNLLTVSNMELWMAIFGFSYFMLWWVLGKLIIIEKLLYGGKCKLDLEFFGGFLSTLLFWF